MNTQERKASQVAELEKRRQIHGPIGALDFLINVESRRAKTLSPVPSINYTPFRCKAVEIPADLEKYRKPPAHFPKNISLPPVQGAGNNYTYLLDEIRNQFDIPVSILILTYNRAEPLRKTLAGLVRQTYPKNMIEVIVSDDGGSEDTLSIVKEFNKLLDIKYVWHRDVGFTPAAARNNAAGIARNDFIILLDVDMFPSMNLVANYVKYAPIIDRAVLIGPRKYVDLNNIPANAIINDSNFEEELEEVRTNNAVAGRDEGEISVDWRLEVFNKTDYLKNESVPFRVFASGNVAFSKRHFMSVGKFDERFNTWGCEDTELGFRFFNAGLYMIPVMGALAYHQEPVGGINETDRSSGKQVSGELFGDICPYYRHLTTKKQNYSVPKVSIYIPTFNAKNTICDAIESALRQTYKDLEVCICDDGSTDGTADVLKKYYSNHPRVRWVSRPNGGIGAASNTALSLCRGIYVGQLDSDDYLAEDVVERCVAVLDRNLKTGLVYTTYENEHPDGSIVNGYNYPVYVREKLLTAMIVHHFRIFRKIYWHRTAGFNERIRNAVDYDMYLKLSEVCDVQHLNIVGYRRRLHGNNTSIIDNRAQNINAAVVVNQAIQRSQLPLRVQLESESSPKLIFAENNS